MFQSETKIPAMVIGLAPGGQALFGTARSQSWVLLPRPPFSGGQKPAFSRLFSKDRTGMAQPMANAD